MTTIWVTDTEPNDRFTLYTRGNVGEVFPHVITPLTGRLIGEAIRQAQSEVLVEMGVLRRREVVGASATTGVFGGYLWGVGGVDHQDSVHRKITAKTLVREGAWR